MDVICYVEYTSYESVLVFTTSSIILFTYIQHYIYMYMNHKIVLGVQIYHLNQVKTAENELLRGIFECVIH
jgi:hypothetical protein